MQFTVNVPTSAGDSVHSRLAFRDEILWNAQVEFAVTVKGLGFGGIAVLDHIMTGSGPAAERFVTLAAIARGTEGVYLHPKTVNNYFWNPALLVKQATTFDAVNDSQLKLGIGAGWRESEAWAYGYDRPGTPICLRMLGGSIRLLECLRIEETVNFDDGHYTLDRAMYRPHPVRGPHPPIIVGGGGEPFTLRITARHADLWNFRGPPEVMQHKLDVLERHCEDYGRPLGEIECSWSARCLLRESEAGLDALLDECFPWFKPENVAEGESPLVGTPGQVREWLVTFVEMGFDEIITEFADLSEATNAELFAEEVVPAFR